jgi:hypothetical protein
VRDDSFAFCAGKSAKLTAISLEESGSPVRVCLLALSALQPAHIIDIIANTTRYGQPIMKLLGLTEDVLPIFAQIVYHFTGGIPHLISRTLESLLAHNIPISANKDLIIKVFN